MFNALMDTALQADKRYMHKFHKCSHHSVIAHTQLVYTIWMTIIKRRWFSVDYDNNIMANGD